jgi:hypothetical protein
LEERIGHRSNGLILKISRRWRELLPALSDF